MTITPCMTVTGNRKRLIELRPVIDVDGARDEVWFFVRGRAYELGGLYFGCNGNATNADVTARGCVPPPRSPHPCSVGTPPRPALALHGDLVWSEACTRRGVAVHALLLLR